MANIQPRDYFIGILLFSLVITAGVAMIDKFQTQSSSFIEPETYTAFNESFNVKTKALDAADNFKGSVFVQNLPQPLEFIATLVLTAFQGLMTLFTGLGFMTTVWSGLTTVFGIPAWVGSVIAAIVSLMITFAILSAILQREI